jgi:hypothetical protein
MAHLLTSASWTTSSNAPLSTRWVCPFLQPKIQHHITKLANNKSPGESGIPAEALKALPPDGVETRMHTPPRFLGGKQEEIMKSGKLPSSEFSIKKAIKKNPQIIKV